MRVSSLSFFLYSLSLVAVVAGQGADPTDDALTDILEPLPSSTDSSATDTSTRTTTEPTDTSTNSDDEPTPTPTTTTTTSSDDDNTSSTDTPTTTSGPTTTTTSTPEPTHTSTNTDDEDTPTTTVTTITTTQTVDGTPVPTTFTSTNDPSGATESPGLSGSSEDSDSGLDSDQKKIIIGVVVGVGGAILIGAIGVVAWRIRARRRNAQDEDVTDLMSGTAVGSGVREKAPSPGAGGTPFRSTLDQYHNPGPVNAASNF
ncbi:putative cell wall protein [Aspergillus lucknowensis]|uniref:Mid2 domain-containing protein n=1 Tax=Aspergillus lucknowensis TaxID=176173 RepID=A0ABR4LV10_9EURO